MSSPQVFVCIDLSLNKSILNHIMHMQYVKSMRAIILLNVTFYWNIMGPPWKLLLEPFMRLLSETRNYGNFSERCWHFPPCDCVTAFRWLMDNSHLRQLTPLRDLSVSWKTLTTNSSLKRRHIQWPATKGERWRVSRQFLRIKITPFVFWYKKESPVEYNQLGGAWNL